MGPLFRALRLGNIVVLGQVVEGLI